MARFYLLIYVLLWISYQEEGENPSMNVTKISEFRKFRESIERSNVASLPTLSLLNEMFIIKDIFFMFVMQNENKE